MTEPKEGSEDPDQDDWPIVEDGLPAPEWALRHAAAVNAYDSAVAGFAAAAREEQG